MNKAWIAQNRAKLETYRDYYRQLLLEDLVPFWESRIHDEEYGGFYACFDREGNLLDDFKPGWFVGRNLYTFANLYNTIEKRESWLALAKDGADWLLRYAHQGGYRFNSKMNRKGEAIDSTKSIFNDAFSVKGYFEYLAALGDECTEEQLAFARDAADALFAHAADAALMDSEGLSAETRVHAVHFMMLLSAMESEQIFGQRYRSQVEAYVEKIGHGFANDTYQAVFETLDAQYQPRLEGKGRLMDPGHALESCWFSMHASELCGNPAYCKRAETVLDWIWAKGWDAGKGGFILLCDVEGGKPRDGHETENYCGTIVNWNDKVWWAQCEGLNALAMSAVFNGNDVHFQRFEEVHAYADKYFRDHEHGEWYGILDKDNQVMRADKGMENKGPYHMVRSAALLYKLFDQCLKEA